jgi:hypothetical protein
VLLTYDGSSRAAGITIYVNGQSQELDVTKDCLTESIVSEATLHLGARSQSTPERYIGSIDDVRIYARQLSSFEAIVLAQSDSFFEAIAAGVLTAAQEKILDDYYMKHVDPEYSHLQTERAAAELEKGQVLDSWPTAMIMDESMIEAMHYGAGAYDVYSGGVQQFCRERTFRAVVYRDPSLRTWTYGAVNETEAETLQPCR